MSSFALTDTVACVPAAASGGEPYTGQQPIGLHLVCRHLKNFPKQENLDTQYHTFTNP
jgi:hypothetical protein